MANKLTKKAFREVLNKRHQKIVEEEQKRLHALPKDFVQREMDRNAGNGAYHARKRKQGDYLYYQDREMFDHLFRIWKTHMSHCFQGEYSTTCKYGEIDCPAKDAVYTTDVKVSGGDE